MGRSLARPVVLLGLALASPALAQPGPTTKRGTAIASETRPDHFPHRIWAACDFEGQTPDYAWFGPAQTLNIPNYPGHTTALGVKEKPYRNFSALMTGINPVPGPMMGKLNKMYCRYYLKGGTEATFQHFSLTVNDNNHIRVSGLTEGKWSELTLNFTRDAARNDGSPKAFQKGERMDDLKVFVGKPNDGKDYELFLDDQVEGYTRRLVLGRGQGGAVQGDEEQMDPHRDQATSASGCAHEAAFSLLLDRRQQHDGAGL
jgi:hypothetical protein